MPRRLLPNPPSFGINPLLFVPNPSFTFELNEEIPFVINSLIGSRLLYFFDDSSKKIVITLL